VAGGGGGGNLALGSCPLSGKNFETNSYVKKKESAIGRKDRGGTRGSLSPPLEMSQRGGNRTLHKDRCFGRPGGNTHFEKLVGPSKGQQKVGRHERWEELYAKYISAHLKGNA